MLYKVWIVGLLVLLWPIFVVVSDQLNMFVLRNGIWYLRNFLGFFFRWFLFLNVLLLLVLRRRRKTIWTAFVGVAWKFWIRPRIITFTGIATIWLRVTLRIRRFRLFAAIAWLRVICWVLRLRNFIWRFCLSMTRFTDWLGFLWLGLFGFRIRLTPAWVLWAPRWATSWATLWLTTAQTIKTTTIRRTWFFDFEQLDYLFCLVWLRLIHFNF